MTSAVTPKVTEEERSNYSSQRNIQWREYNRILCNGEGHMEDMVGII